MIEYNSYVNACVTHTTEQSYTSDMMYYASMNYAATSGNDRVTQGIVSYNYDISDECMRLQHNTTSKSKYSSYYQSIHDIHSSMGDSMDTGELLDVCVNMSAMDRIYLDNCDYSQSNSQSNSQSLSTCPTDPGGLSYYPPSVYLSGLNETCNTTGVSGSNLYVDVFNCEVLPACSVSSISISIGIVSGSTVYIVYAVMYTHNHSMSTLTLILLLLLYTHFYYIHTSTIYTGDMQWTQ